MFHEGTNVKELMFLYYNEICKITVIWWKLGMKEIFVNES